MSLTEQEDDLFERWKKTRPRLIRDGVVDESSYLSSSPRVVLVLKDVNDEGGGPWDLRDVLRKGMRWQTWNNVTRWLRGIRNLDRELTWSDITAKPKKEERIAAVRSLCVINLKKEPGGASSNRDAVNRYAHEDSTYLAEQFELYRAELVICGGVGDTFASIIGVDGWQRTSRGLSYIETESGCHIIDYYHPQVRYPLEMLYYGLLDGVRELRG